MAGVIWGIVAAAGCVALYITMTEFLKYKSPETPEPAKVYEYPKLDITDKFDKFIWEEIYKEVGEYVENDEGELHAVIDCAKVRAVMDKLALEHSFIREKVWP